MPKWVQHPVYEWIKVNLQGAGLPKYDGTQNCAQIGLEAFYYSADEGDEPWFVEGDPRPSSMRQLRLPYPTYSRHDAFLLKVCHDCPFLAECFAHAVVNEEYGFWGGTNPGDRNRLRRTHRVRLNKNFTQFTDNDARLLAKLLQQATEQEEEDGVG